MIKDNLKEILDDIKDGNNLGEKITLVGATKFVDIERINEAIDCGLEDIGENKAQEFKEKFPSVHKCNYHFFGYLQTNKIKYLIGKVYLIQSVDRYELIDEINRQSINKNLVTHILLEVNIGEDENKHGFILNDIDNALMYTKKLNGIKVDGLMSMFPIDNEEKIALLTQDLRKKYDEYKEEFNFKYLSCGISEDYKIAIKNGSNMIRVGTKIFGKRY